MNYKTIATVFFGITLVISTLYAIDKHKQKPVQTAADVILIDSMKSFGELERPGVTFLHDRHSEILKKQGKDCSTCHQTKDDRLIHMFNRTEDVDKEMTLDKYHTGCIGCHEENVALKQDSGPVECGECHTQNPTITPSRQVVEFDASLHYRHIEAADSKCETCHHSYDESNQKLIYQKGSESSCKSCHKDEAIGKTINYQAAAHQACIGCHQQELAKQTTASQTIESVECASCHDEGRLKRIAKLEKVPRLEMNQPDLTFIKSFDKQTKGTMAAVLFNHQGHENSVENCSTCHHESIESCDNCHTLQGAKEGNGVTLAQAMHNTDSDKSCIGCHTEVKQQADCAGCHSLIKAQDNISDTQSCQSCHAVPIDKIAKDKKSGLTIDARNYHSVASKNTKVNLEMIPEEYMIDVISETYQGVRFPHRAIVESMMDRIKDSTLAASFHQKEEAICQSCHHNSQDNFNPPPKCISCHSSSEGVQDDSVPATKAAYHRQCFECHEAMDITKPASADCVACHKEK